MATETVITREAPDIEAYKLGLMEQAKSLVSAPPIGGLPPVRAAGETEAQIQARLLAGAGVGSYLPYLTQGSATLGTGQGAMQTGLANIYGSAVDQTGAARGLVQGAGTGAMGQVAGAQGTIGGATQAYDPASAAAYMNPYQQAVADEINRAFDIQQNQAAGQAASQGAFGFSRGIIDQREIDRNRASALAQAQAQNFIQAQDAARSDFANQQARQMQAGEISGQLGLAGLEQQRAAGMGLGQLGLAQQDAMRQAGLAAGQLGQGLGTLGMQQAGIGELLSNLGRQEVATLADLGERERQINQAILESQRQTNMQDIFEPYQRLGFYSDILRGAPSTQMVTSQAATPQPSLLNQLLGAGIGGLSLYGAASKAFGT
tara:strand:+ start:140 stop:1264 length:1125 start_codon:yes stop_codon:yes gene_type:complete